MVNYWGIVYTSSWNDLHLEYDKIFTKQVGEYIPGSSIKYNIYWIYYVQNTRMVDVFQ